MTDSLKEETFEEAASLEGAMKAALEANGRNASPGTDQIPTKLCEATGTKSVKILTRLGQQIWETNKPRPLKLHAVQTSFSVIIILSCNKSIILLEILQEDKPRGTIH